MQRRMASKTSSNLLESNFDTAPQQQPRKHKSKKAFKQSFEQGIPRSFRTIFDQKYGLVSQMNDFEASTGKKRKRKKLISHGDFSQHKNESDTLFLARVNRETVTAFEEHMMSIKYDLNAKTPLGASDNPEPDLVNNPGFSTPNKSTNSDGVSKPNKRKRSRKRKHGDSIEKTAADSSKGPHIEEDEIVAPKIKKKKSKKQWIKGRIDLLNQTEIIPFGERVDAPPNLSAIPRRGQKLQKAGKRDLLLKSYMSETIVMPQLDQKRDKFINDGTIKVDNPRKQFLLEKERTRIIENYRMMKSLKNSM